MAKGKGKGKGNRSCRRCIPVFILVATALVSGLHRDAAAQFESVKTDDVNLIYYNFGHEYLVNHTIRSYTNALRFHKEKFGYELREPVTLIMSDFGDFANGGASAVPNNIILMGIAPFHYAFETNPANERINVLMNHELVHIVAQDKPSATDRFFRTVFSGKVYPDRHDPVSVFYSYLTAPRIFSPRWYHEGIAEYMTTWMSGGIGRVMGAYDEMMFRTMVRDSAHMYDAVGLESEGTTVDFQIGANSYMYGTRFMTWLSLEHDPESLLRWVSRDDGSRSSFARQFRRVYGAPLDDKWSEWIAWENEWQQENLRRIRTNPVTGVRVLSRRPLGGVSRGIYDEERDRIYAAVDLPGTVSHIASINPQTGTMRRITDVRGSALYFVSSIAFDPATSTLFYTNDHNNWRDLYAVDVGTGKSRRLIRDSRTGDLVFNPHDRSLWGIRHFNGIVSIVRIPYPYQEWNRIHSMPYGEDLFDIDLSPDGKWLSAATANVSGHQKLVLLSTDSLMAGGFQPEEIFDFEVSSPSSFAFSKDGRYLFGSTYYSGVSNIVRYDLENRQMRWLSNAETGLFRPVPVSADSLIAFEYTGTGFIPVKMANQPVERVSAIRFLGQEVVERHEQLKGWMLPPPNPAQFPVEEMIIERSSYSPFRNLSIVSVYPIVQGYKDYAAGGLRLNAADQLRLHNLGITFSYSPHPNLSGDEHWHGSFLYEMPSWSLFGNYNGADFYDLFGPTKRSRKGYSLGMGYKKELYRDINRTLDMNLTTAYYGGLERLPEFQNIITSFSEFFSLSGKLTYRDMLSSLGAVDYEKGLFWELNTFNNYVEGTLFPRINQNLDYGFALPVRHASLWFRTSTGYSFSPRAEPLGNFYFGGFGNNWVDHLPSRRYRSFYSFPGVELNQLGGTNFGKLMTELALPPVRFRRVGITNLYATWAQLNLFGSGLVTNVDHPDTRQRYYNAGAQVDVRMAIFSILESTFSVGYASAWNHDTGRRSEELMVSLRLLR